MTRLLLTWIGFTILQLGAPRPTGAAELRPGGESARLVPRLEALASDLLAGERFRSDDRSGSPTQPFAPAEPARIGLLPLRSELPPDEPGRRGPVTARRFLPEARAPPA